MRYLSYVNTDINKKEIIMKNYKTIIISAVLLSTLVGCGDNTSTQQSIDSETNNQSIVINSSIDDSENSVNDDSSNDSEKKYSPSELAQIRNGLPVGTMSYGGHLVCLRTNGTVVVDLDTNQGEADVDDWNDIIAVSAGKFHTVGLKSDGTVLAVGNMNRMTDGGQCKVDKWTDIVAITAGKHHTVGLKSDGTCVGVGTDEYGLQGPASVGRWENIVSIAAGDYFTIGLKNDGTVEVASGYGTTGMYGRPQFTEKNGKYPEWTDIVAVAAGYEFIVGLKKDGTVVAETPTPLYRETIEEVSNWSNIVAIEAGYGIVGLKADGTVVTAGYDRGTTDIDAVNNWSDIVAISADGYHIVGLKSDGSLCTDSFNENGTWAQWHDIKTKT